MLTNTDLLNKLMSIAQTISKNTSEKYVIVTKREYAELISRFLRIKYSNVDIIVLKTS